MRRLPAPQPATFHGLEPLELRQLMSASAPLDPSPPAPDAGSPTAQLATVTPGNAGPTNILPPADSTARDTPLVFSSANGNAIVVSDPDLADDELLRVVLSVTDGTLTLAQTTGLTLLAGDGNDDAVISIAGTQERINQALDGLTFTPATGFSGSADLRVFTEDLDRTDAPGQFNRLFEAEDGLAGAGDGYVISRFDNPSGGLAVQYVGPATFSDPGPDPGISLRFVAPVTGLYELRLEAFVRFIGQNSTFIGIEGADLARSQGITRPDGLVNYNDIPVTDGFAFTPVLNADNGSSEVRFFLEAGEHAIRIQGRERNLRVDRVYLTLDPESDLNDADAAPPLNATGQTRIFVNTPGNLSPVHADDAFALDEDTALTVTTANGLLANDRDPDGDPLTAGLAVGPVNGVIALNPDGSFTYTPNADFFGTDSFTYTVTDGNGGLSIGTAAFTVNPVDDLPLAANDRFAGTDQTPLTGVVSANDTPSADGGNVYTLAPGQSPLNGSLTLNPDGSFTYTPDRGFDGRDAFTYLLTDGDGDAASATVELSVTAVPPAGALAVAAQSLQRTSAPADAPDPDDNATPPRVHTFVPDLTPRRQTSGPADLGRAAPGLPASSAAYQWALAEGRSPAERQGAGPEQPAPQGASPAAPLAGQLAPGGRLTFTPLANNTLRLQDQNNPQQIIRLTLSVEHGHLTLGTEKGLALEEVLGRVERDAAPDQAGRTTARSITVRGSAQAIERALDGLTYRTLHDQPDNLSLRLNPSGPRPNLNAPQPQQTIAIHPVDLPADLAPAPAAPTGLAEVPTESGHLSTSLLGLGLLGWLLRRRDSDKPTA